MKCNRLHLLLLLIVVVSLNCSNTIRKNTQLNGMYYWKSYFYIGEGQTFFSENNISKLYIKFFDVGIDSEGKPFPEGTIHFGSAIPDLFTGIIPVVYITNNTIASLDSSGVEILSGKLIERLQKEIKRTGIGKRVPEIQIDCDWTVQTRNKYFYLLRLIKKSIPYQLSATIRLHQYKYHQHNIPPVDKGLLMCYNVFNPTSFDVNNSIFDYEEIKKYTVGVTYPIKLDLALPVFGWGVMFDAQKQFEGFTSYIRLEDIRNDTSFAATSRPNVFLSLTSGEKYDRYFQKGQYVRVEEVNIKEVLDIKQSLWSELHQAQPTLLLFSYDESTLNHIKDHDLKDLFSRTQ